MNVFNECCIREEECFRRLENFVYGYFFQKGLYESLISSFYVAFGYFDKCSC